MRFSTTNDAALQARVEALEKAVRTLVAVLDGNGSPMRLRIRSLVTQELLPGLQPFGAMTDERD